MAKKQNITKVAILGAGVAGMAACKMLEILNERNRINYDVRIYSKDIGGDYAAGGLKYIEYTPFISRYYREILKYNDFMMKEVYGCVLLRDGFEFPIDNMVQAGSPSGRYRFGQTQIEEFPKFMREERNSDIAIGIQKAHIEKTVGASAGYDKTAMNDPFKEGRVTELAVVDRITHGYYGRIDLDNKFLWQELIKSASDKIINADIDSELIHSIFTNHDLVISTIPLAILARYIYDNWWTEDSYPKGSVTNSIRLSKYSVTLPDGFPDEVPWERFVKLLNKHRYIYTPERQDVYRFHRVGILNWKPEFLGNYGWDLEVETSMSAGVGRLHIVDDDVEQREVYDFLQHCWLGVNRSVNPMHNRITLEELKKYVKLKRHKKREVKGHIKTAFDVPKIIKGYQDKFQGAALFLLGKYGENNSSIKFDDVVKRLYMLHDSILIKQYFPNSGNK